MTKAALRLRVASMAIFAFLSSAIFAQTGAKHPIGKADFGKTPDGRSVEIYTLTNSNGAEMRVITYGGTIVSLKMPDRNGKFGDVVLGFDNVADYQKQTAFIGALIGRYGNRIGNAAFTLDGKRYQLAANNGKNSLHGGPGGFHTVVWTAEPKMTPAGPSVVLRYSSADGEEGFPGKLDVIVTYTLTDKNEVRVHYSAVTDKPTVVNLTQHSYFNLAGGGSIGDHILSINADRVTPTDEGQIPTGDLASVTGTPFDFRKPQKIGSRIDSDDIQMKYGFGYDHNWVLNKKRRQLSRAAAVYEPVSGRYMEVLTTEPGLQFYSGNFLDGTPNGKSGAVYSRRTGFCLEAQHYPDSPNKPFFPSTELQPGEIYTQTTIYRFSVRKK